MADGDRAQLLAGVYDLEAQVSAFAGLAEALRDADDLLGEVGEGLARAGGGAPLRTRWTATPEVRAVALA